MLARTSASGTTAWYLTDDEGSVRDIVNSSGVVIDHIAYDSFGNVTTESNAANGDRFKYDGMQFDQAIDDYYDNARYYDPVTGRFLQQDPTGFAAGDANLYRFTGNGPTNATDPSGTVASAIEQSEPQAGAAGGDPGIQPQSNSLTSGPAGPPSLAGAPYDFTSQGWLGYDQLSAMGVVSGYKSGNTYYYFKSEQMEQQFRDYLNGRNNPEPDPAYTPSQVAPAPAPASAPDGGGQATPARPKSIMRRELDTVGLGWLLNPIEGLAEDAVTIGNLGNDINQNYEINQAKNRQKMDPNWGMMGDLNARNRLTPAVSDGLQTVTQLLAENSAFAGGGLGLTTTKPTRGDGLSKLEAQAHKNAERKGCPAGSFRCFPAGTLVAIEGGRKAIELLGPRERVWAFDLASGDWRPSPVVKAFHHRHEGLIARVGVAGEVIEATPRHPFWVIRGEGLDERPLGDRSLREEEGRAIPGRWVEASDLRVGDEVWLLDGRIAAVEDFELRPFEGLVYNFEVGELHCYAVGAGGVLVHNDSDLTPSASKATPAPKSGLGSAKRLSPDELATGQRLEAKLGKSLTESSHVGAEYVDDLGKTYDALGTPKASQFWNESKFLKSIDGHLLKSNDFTVIDLTGFTPSQIAAVERHLATLTPEQLARIMRIGF